MRTSPAPIASRRRAGCGDGRPSREFTALDGGQLDVQPGELFGLLGPNGAGKTTLIKILTTLLAPIRGKAWVDGLDVVTQAHELRPRINMVSGGESSGYGILNVRENLWLFARIYGVPDTPSIKRRIDEMLDVVGLTDKANSRVSHLSTGQRQKMNFCRGFITDPKILFLDEPTLGLDVTSRPRIRAVHPRVDEGGPEPHAAADDALHGRGRRAVRPAGDHRPGARCWPATRRRT